MSMVVLRRLLRERLAAGCDAAGIPPARRNWEGAAFTPPDPVALHVRETLIPGAERVVAVAGDAVVTDAAGVYQVDVYAPADLGTAAIDEAVEALRAAFRPGALASAPDLHLEITGASPLAISEDDRRLQVPLSITWRARRAVPRS